MISNLEYLKVFYYTAKCGSVTKAAALLSISQPAVSQSIHQLEKSMDTTLFTRASRGLKLTAEGELLYSYVAKGYEQMELGVENLRRMQNLELGEVRIGASDMTLQFYLLPYLEKFHERYPDIKVIVTNGPTPETLDALKEERIDFGVVSTPFDAEDSIISTPVREIKDVFVAGRRFISYKNKTLDFEDLKDLPLVFLEQNTSSRRYMDQYLHRNGVDIQPEFELSTSDMIVQFALRNLGVGCVVKDFAKEALESGVLFELRFNRHMPSRNFCLVQLAGKQQSPAAMKLLQIIQEKN